MLIFEICASFVPALQGVVMILAMVGGILSLVWEVLVALTTLPIESHILKITG